MPDQPKAAATCILVRGGDDPEILLARRNPNLRFMAGHHVFPGGRIQADESLTRVLNATDEAHATAILTVVREVFEETGLLCVQGALPDRDALRAARHRLLDEETGFEDLLETHELHIDAADFEPAGNWLTPSFVPIRFATHYFLHRVRSDQREELIEGEIVGLEWLSPAEARHRWHRGELRLSTPVAYTLRQLAAAGLSQALPRLQRGTERAPGEHNWFEIRRGITLVPVKSVAIPPATHTNCIIVGEKNLFVVDPGPKGDAEREHLLRQIDHLIELGGNVEAVLLTHSHPDHVSAADELRGRYGAPVMAHAATAAALPFKVDRHLQDGDVLTSGGEPQWRLECLFTPGHDPGHLCFLETSTGTLIAGDMVANPGTIIVSRQFAGDMSDFMQSLERLLDVDCKLIIPAHGQPAGKPRAFIEQHLTHRRWREGKIKQAYDSGATTFDALLAQAYDDAPEAALPWARHALDAHLAKLGIDMPGF